MWLWKIENSKPIVIDDMTANKLLELNHEYVELNNIVIYTIKGTILKQQIIWIGNI